MTTATSNARAAYVTRDAIMNLLSNDEVARVSTAETGARLQDGEEYLDLEHLDQGVRRAGGAPAQMGHVLPRTAVRDETWAKILKALAGTRGATKPSGQP